MVMLLVCLTAVDGAFAHDWQFDPGNHCFVIAVHVALSRCFCILAVFEPGSFIST